MGYLAELLKKEALANFIAFAQKQVNQKYTLLEPGGPNEGPFNKRWQLRMNMSEATILDTINSHY
jgi:predicted transcriptional regulator of viral defense system